MSGNSRFAVCVHILAYLACRQEQAVTSAEIASSVDTNPVVIRRLLAALVKAGLVATRKGAGGGFLLAVDPKECSLLRVNQAIDPTPDHGLGHFAPNHRCPVGARIEAILHEVFDKAHAARDAELAAVSLAAVHDQLTPVCTQRR